MKNRSLLTLWAPPRAPAQTRASETLGSSKTGVSARTPGGKDLCSAPSLFPSFFISFCCTSVVEGMDSRNGRDTQGSSSRLMLWPLPDCWWHFCSVTQNQKGLRRKHHKAWAEGFRAPLHPPALSRLHLGIWIAFLLKRFCDRKSETQWLWRVLENSACKEQLRK